MSKEIKDVKVTAEMKRVLQALANCGLLTDMQARQIVGNSNRKLEALESEGYIYLEELNIEDKTFLVYGLGVRGEDYLKTVRGENRAIYKGFLSGGRYGYCKDIKLAKHYMGLSVKEQNSWITKNELMEQYGIGGAFDGVFIRDVDGASVGVKVLSPTSSKQAIYSAQEFLKRANIDESYYLL